MLAQQSVIETLPILPENMLATGYSSLQLTTQIEHSDAYEACQWNYEGYVPVLIKTFFVGCENRTEYGSTILLVCTEENNQITSSLIIHFPIESPVRVRVECVVVIGDPFEVTSFINLSVKGK